MLFIYLINSQLHKIHKCQTNDSPVEYNCKISRQKTALTDTLTDTLYETLHLKCQSTAGNIQWAVVITKWQLDGHHNMVTDE